VSVRTVDSHLARIYRKTGQRGRVALANWWRDRAA
jgi:DNA-binding CsgD family transcriptional regulator